MMRADDMCQHLRALVAKQLPRWPVITPRAAVIAAMHPRLRQARDRFTLGDRSLVIIGPSGAGKTTFVAESVLRYVERPDATAGELRGLLAWTTGHALAAARREAPLGRRAPLIDRCVDARVLVIDELGQEPLSEVPFEIVDLRYAAGRSTVVTSGLPSTEFRARYGDAMWRRLTQDGVGANLDLHGGKGG